MEGQRHAREQWVSAEGGVYDDLPNVATHTLVMWGNLDVVDPPANGRLKHVTHHVFKGAGHAFLFQDAKEVGRTVSTFLH